MLLASIAKTQELAIDETEAKLLAKSLAEVAEHYEAVAVSPKTIAWVGLMQALGMVYGPRIWVLRQKAGAAKSKPRPAPTPSTPSASAEDSGLPGPRVVNL